MSRRSTDQRTSRYSVKSGHDHFANEEEVTHRFPTEQLDLTAPVSENILCNLLHSNASDSTNSNCLNNSSANSNHNGKRQTLLVRDLSYIAQTAPGPQPYRVQCTKYLPNASTERLNRD